MSSNHSPPKSTEFGDAAGNPPPTPIPTITHGNQATWNQAPSSGYCSSVHSINSEEERMLLDIPDEFNNLPGYNYQEEGAGRWETTRRREINSRRAHPYHKRIPTYYNWPASTVPPKGNRYRTHSYYNQVKDYRNPHIERMERVNFGPYGTPPPINKNHDRRNSKATVAKAMEQAISVEDDLIALRDWTARTIAHVSEVANRAEATANEAVRRNTVGMLELRGSGMPDPTLDKTPAVKLFCDLILKKYGVKVATNELKRVQWMGPALCGHFVNLKEGTSYDKLTNREKYLGGWGGLPEAKGVKINLDRYKTNQERNMVSALTWLKERQARLYDEGKITGSQVSIVKVKTLANGIAYKRSLDKEAPLIIVKSMAEVEALFETQELLEFKQERKANKKKNKKEAKKNHKEDKKGENENPEPTPAPVPPPIPQNGDPEEPEPME